ncbi:hypothetical protein NCC49_002900 [Naganishia albida]|nr:hypothetical protein NCC49_002900 [Naganishia albida]
MALGRADYTRTPTLLHRALECLLSNVSIATKAPQQDVETRQASYHSLLSILQQCESSIIQLQPGELSTCFKSFVDGLEDYSTDQRGDVGSWIRITCAHSLPELIRLVKRIEGRVDRLACLDAVRGLLKLSVEKLEIVRVSAGPALREILEAHAKELGMGESYAHIRTIDDWKDVQSLYPRIADLLKVESIQRSVFEGLVLSVGGKNMTTHNAAANAITGALQSSRADPALVDQLTRTLLTFGTENLNKQRVFTPVLMTAFELAQAEVWNGLNPASTCTQDLIKLVNLAARGLTIMKNIERLTSSMKFIVSCLTIPVTTKTALRHVPNLINHAFPRIRTLTVEQLYLALQTAGIEDPALDELLLNVDWAESDYGEAAKELVKLLATAL